MDKKYSFDRRALMSLGTVTILAPALRLFPIASTALAGRAAWLSAPAAAPLMTAYVFFLCALMDKRREGENLQALGLRILGRRAGRAFLLLTAAWLILYAGFELRSGAERLIATVYPYSKPGAFSTVMGIIALAAVLGSERGIVRSACIIHPFVMAAMLLVLFFAAFSVNTDNLLPVSSADIAPVFAASLSAVDVVSAGAYTLCFFTNCVPVSAGAKRAYTLWVLSMLALLTLLVTAIIGCFGAELTALLTHPFFVLVRNLVFFKSIERVEALVVMLWIFPDFLQVALLLFAAQYALRLFIGKDAEYRTARIFDFSEGRYFIWLCAAAAIALSLIIAQDSFSMERWSQSVIPILNLIYGFILLPIIYIVGKMKKA